MRGICSGSCRTQQQKFDVVFEIFLVFFCLPWVLSLFSFLLFLGFLNLTQKTEATNDLLIFFFMLVQIDHSHLKLWSLSTQGTQRYTVKKILCSKRMRLFRDRMSLLSVNRLTVQKARYTSGCGRNLSCEVFLLGYILPALFEWMEQKLRINQPSSKPCFILWF